MLIVFVCQAIYFVFLFIFAVLGFPAESQEAVTALQTQGTTRDREDPTRADRIQLPPSGRQLEKRDNWRNLSARGTAAGIANMSCGTWQHALDSAVDQLFRGLANIVCGGPTDTMWTQRRGLLHRGELRLEAGVTHCLVNRRGERRKVLGRATNGPAAGRGMAG